MTKFVVTTLVCVFWNGVVWAVIGNFWLVSRQHSEPLSLFVLLFFVPFIIVGLLMTAFAVYQFLALFNPRPHLTLSHPVLVPGQPTELRWRFHTDPRRIERLQFWLEGAEVQVHGHGKERRIERKQFAKIDLADVTRFTEVAAGRLEIRLPPDVRPSQELSQPQIEWRLLGRWKRFGSRWKKVELGGSWWKYGGWNEGWGKGEVWEKRGRGTRNSMTYDDFSPAGGRRFGPPLPARSGGKIC